MKVNGTAVTFYIYLTVIILIVKIVSKNLVQGYRVVQGIKNKQRFAKAAV